MNPDSVQEQITADIAFSLVMALIKQNAPLSTPIAMCPGMTLGDFVSDQEMHLLQQETDK